MTLTQTDKPTDAAVLERAFSLANEAIFTVELQRRRVRSPEPEDAVFAFRYWADLQFLIVALRRLRRAAELASNVRSSKEQLRGAIKRFDDAIPVLLTMRNVGEHIADYAMDGNRRRHTRIHRLSLQVGDWDGTTYKWLGEELNVDNAHQAALGLYAAVRYARSNSLRELPHL